MRSHFFPAAALTLAVLCGAAAQSPARAPRNKADIERLMTELSNWGRWGRADQTGTVNLITAARRREAAALVRTGKSISLSHDVLLDPAPDNPDAFGHLMTYTGAHPNGDWFMDQYTVRFHGLAHTHMDSLAHSAWNGKMYNGFPQLDVTEKGAAELGITGFRDGIFARAVIMDIPRLKGLPYLEPGTAVYPEDLEAWEKKTGVKVGPGDVVFIRTGRWARRAALGPWDPEKMAGPHASCVPWLKKRDVAIAGSDACLDVLPSLVEGVVQPVHQLLLIAMGMPILDNCDLEAAAAEAAGTRHWAFLVTASPLAVPGGTGSPLNPTAVF